MKIRTLCLISTLIMVFFVQIPVFAEEINLADTAWITTKYQPHYGDEEDVTDPEDAIAVFFGDDEILFLGSDYIRGSYSFDGENLQTDKDIYGEVTGDELKLYLPDGLYRILVKTSIIDAVRYSLWVEDVMGEPFD